MPDPLGEPPSMSVWESFLPRSCSMDDRRMRRGRPAAPVGISGWPTGPVPDTEDPLRELGLLPRVTSPRLGEERANRLFCFSRVRLTQEVHGPGRCSPASSSRISSFSLADPSAKAAFLSLATAAATVTLTATHKLPAGPAKALKQASEVAVGELGVPVVLRLGHRGPSVGTTIAETSARLADQSKNIHRRVALCAES